MTAPITYTECKAQDFEALLKMSQKLLQDFDEFEIRKILQHTYSVKRQKIRVSKVLAL